LTPQTFVVWDFCRAEQAQLAGTAAKEVGLAEKLDSAAGELSGGQRRKLSVALAFVGDPSGALGQREGPLQKRRLHLCCPKAAP
jgi:ABC-type Mn2+/Zn2+ transport system ATPase subunit